MSHTRRTGVTAPAQYALEALEQRTLLAFAFALDANNHLLAFKTNRPGDWTRNAPIAGLSGGEQILAIDYRPATGGLYGLGSESRLYFIDGQTNLATQVGSDFAVPLEGDSFDLDFDPSLDLIRVVSNIDQNLRIHPDTGAVVDFDTAAPGVQPDGELAFTAGDDNDGEEPVVVAAAYDTNVFAADAPTMWALDSAADALLKIGSDGGSPGSPNTGELSTVGPLGEDFGKRASLDVFNEDGTDTAFAALLTAGQVKSSLYTIDLDTGDATRIGSFQEHRIIDIAVRPPLPPRVISLTHANELLTIDSYNPTRLIRRVRITGLEIGEHMVGIDFRPAGELVGVSTEGKIYTVNPANGGTVRIGTGTGAPTSGVATAFDFNPAAGHFRLVGDADQNVRLNPLTGGIVDSDSATPGTQPDDDLAFDAGDVNAGANPNVVAVAYTGNDEDAATPATLYGIDSTLNVLVRHGSMNGAPVSPNAGTLFTVGPLSTGARSAAGLDIVIRDGRDEAFAAFRLEGTSEQPGLYRINLATGVATRLGTIAGNQTIIGLAVYPI